MFVPLKVLHRLAYPATNVPHRDMDVVPWTPTIQASTRERNWSGTQGRIRASDCCWRWHPRASPGAHEGVEEVAAVLGDGGQAASYRAELSVRGGGAVAAEIRCRSLIMRMSGSVPLLSTTASRPAPPPKTAGRPATDAIAPG